LCNWRQHQNPVNTSRNAVNPESVNMVFVPFLHFMAWPMLRGLQCRMKIWNRFHFSQIEFLRISWGRICSRDIRRCMSLSAISARLIILLFHPPSNAAIPSRWLCIGYSSTFVYLLITFRLGCTASENWE
jgi:hypothetical protein